MATLADILAALRVDLADPNGEVFDDGGARRAVDAALVDLNADLGTAYALVDTGGGAEAIAPEPSAGHREMLVLLAAARLAGSLKVRHAEAIKFTSGDKSADLTSAYKQWAETEVAFATRYRERLLRLRPELGDDVFNLTGVPAVRSFDTACEADGLCVEGVPWP